MAVYKRGYERYTGPLTSHRQRVFAYCRLVGPRLFSQRLVLIVLIASMFWPMGCLVYVYAANNLELLRTLGGGGPLFRVDGSFFLVFMSVQAVFATLLASLVGPQLISPDLSGGALPLYFSRPISRLDYFVARMATLGEMLGLITLLPALILIVVQTGMAGWDWLRANWRLGVGVPSGLLLWMVLVGFVSLVSSIWVRTKLVASAFVLGFFFVLAGTEQMLREVLRADWPALLNPTRASYLIWCDLLGVEPPAGPAAWQCWVSLLVLIGTMGVILERKLRPVEVVT